MDVMMQTQLDEITAELNMLREQNALLRAKISRPRAMTLKVSDKGALSVYGVGRFPVTLYASQWRAVLGIAEDIKAFMSENASYLIEKSV